MNRTVNLAFVSSCILLFAIPMIGQTAGSQRDAAGYLPAIEGPIEPDAYGVTAWSSLTIPSWDFESFGYNDIWAYTFFGGRYFSHASSSGVWVAPFSLPTGVEIIAFEVQGCDKSAAQNFTIEMLRGGVSTSSDIEVVQSLGSTTSSGSTECGWWGYTLPAPHLVDSFNFMYRVHVLDQAKDGTLVVQGVRVFYRRRVSSPPAVASFFDVPPSHPFFQFVEALAASGITAGCSADYYCPDSPVTRGQMAVFLAKALGLHWPY